MSVGLRSKARLRPARLRRIDFARHASDSIKEEIAMGDALVNLSAVNCHPLRGSTWAGHPRRSGTTYCRIGHDLGTHRRSP